MLFVFRAIQGIGEPRPVPRPPSSPHADGSDLRCCRTGAALTIPSALTMITTLFPERGEQDRALGMCVGPSSTQTVLRLTSD